MPRNNGKMPAVAKGRRVRIRFVNGFDSASYDPPHWPAESVRWDISDPPHPSDVAFWKVEA